MFLFQEFILTNKVRKGGRTRKCCVGYPWMAFNICPKWAWDPKPSKGVSFTIAYCSTWGRVWGVDKWLFICWIVWWQKQRVPQALNEIPVCTIDASTTQESAILSSALAAVTKSSLKHRLTTCEHMRHSIILAAQFSAHFWVSDTLSQQRLRVILYEDVSTQAFRSWCQPAVHSNGHRGMCKKLKIRWLKPAR